MPSYIETKLGELGKDIKTYAAASEKRFGDLQTVIADIDRKAAARAMEAASEPETPLLRELKSNESLQRLLQMKQGRSVISLQAAALTELFERKTTITSAAVGSSTSGVLQIERLPGVTAEPRQTLTLRSLLTARPTTFQVIDFVRVSSPMAIASPVAEGAAKPENAVTFATASDRVKTIATWIPASRQVLEDVIELEGFLKSSLAFYVDLAEEQQLLSGDGTGENLHGLIPQATAFNTGLLSTTRGWNTIDIIGRAIQQIKRAKELPPKFLVIHPDDWGTMRLTKDSSGRYILGDPESEATEPRLFGLKVLDTTSIAAGTFLVGSGDAAAAEIRDRQEVVIEISTAHGDFFLKNLIAVLCERRSALIVKRPGSYVSGSFTQSPA